ncbi:MAG: 4-(cytidine 5'-diphospho)-2-C-methyl-D-erythritol kinase [Magnetococcales bacterium]|nr:4-(cytidine 5'-diphospho)-2-C-methyl-D-erythritol kinase [Magnetococcales bacterium]
MAPSQTHPINLKNFLMKAQFSAPAKVNLALRVVGKRSDGYHLLQTVMTFFPLYDLLEIEILPQRGRIELSCQPEVTPKPEDNLIYKTAKAFGLATGVDKGVAIKLTKNIPHGGGLGGGSSNAATTLLALNKMWDINWSLDKLIELGVSLGADIPIFLGGRGALAQGIGEKLTFLPDLPTATLVLLNPGETISTKEVFKALAGNFPHHPHPLEADTIKEGCLPALLENDLEPIVKNITPIITEMTDSLLSTGANATLMSGSGSSLFGYFNKKEQASKAVNTLKQRHPNWKIMKGTTFNIHPFAKEWKSSIVHRH